MNKVVTAAAILPYGEKLTRLKLCRFIIRIKSPTFQSTRFYSAEQASPYLFHIFFKYAQTERKLDTVFNLRADVTPLHDITQITVPGVTPKLCLFVLFLVC